MKYTIALVLLAACAGSTGSTGATVSGGDAEPRKVAELYLASMVDPNQQAGRELLLGGVTIDAKMAKAAEAKVVADLAPRREDGSVPDLKKQVNELDKSGLELLGDSAAISGAGGNHRDVSLAEAQKLREKTKQLRKELVAKFPVFSDVIRADRTLYWHPKNPARTLLTQAGEEKAYHVDYVSFTVETKEVAGAPAKQWPLRVVRFKSGKFDTGWKVLPASEWDPE